MIHSFGLIVNARHVPHLVAREIDRRVEVMCPRGVVQQTACDGGGAIDHAGFFFFHDDLLFGWFLGFFELFELFDADDHRHRAVGATDHVLLILVVRLGDHVGEVGAGVGGRNLLHG